MAGQTLIPSKDFFDGYTESVLITDAADQLVYINPSFSELTGFTEDTLNSFQLLEWLPQIQTIEKKKTVTVGDKNDSHIQLNVSVSPITLSDKSVGKVYTFFNLQNELTVLNSKLQKTVEESEQLAYVASHDLQEPLRTITSYIQLIQKNLDRGNTEAVKEFMKFVVEGAGRMQGLINDLLQYSRISKKGNPHTEVNLNDIIKVVQAQLAGKIQETGATFNIITLPKVQGDPAQLSKLLFNIVDNALKFKSPERQPEIDISVEEKGEEYLFAIRDNGLSIDEKFYNRIFVIFQRLHTRGEYEGTGLGLAICKKIVEQHGGEIWVTSEKGKGSTFYFTLKK